MSDGGDSLATLNAERARLAKPSTLPPARRIRDAGTLLIVDHSHGTARVLMGRRSSGHVFMPGRYVFPGGRIDPSDLALAREFSLSELAFDRLCAGPPARFDRRRATATALAAIRETFEEAGAMIGATGSFSGKGEYWNAFGARGIRPAPEMLVPIARAITPPGPPRRYDTRFFCVSADAIGHQLDLSELPTDELEALAWVDLDALQDLSLAPITLRIVSDLKARIADGTWQDPAHPMPFYRAIRGRFIRESL
ncbi:NUDIX domain-containing protein [Aurantimonas sp. A2-1-M11]|uniref:NUDIX domain-containing protein n=1 Tax=Aurantimonas sp. A2-1-M11 TaxID=3113712 RepID=UPI002F957B2A